MAVSSFLFYTGMLLGIGAAHPSFDGRLRQNKDGALEAFLKPPFVSNHAATLELLPDGTLALAKRHGSTARFVDIFELEGALRRAAS